MQKGERISGMGTRLRVDSSKTGTVPARGCPRSLRCKPRQFHGSQTLGTAPDAPGGSPEFTAALLNLSSFQCIPNILGQISPSVGRNLSSGPQRLRQLCICLLCHRFETIFTQIKRRQDVIRQTFEIIQQWDIVKDGSILIHG